MKEIKQLIEKLQPHDAVFKSSLKYVAVAKKFFEIHLPSNVLDLIDLETLLLCSESFITNSLQKYDSDLIYTVKYKNNRSNEHVYLLIEHESSVNSLMLFRLHNYLNLIIQQHLKQTKNTKILPLGYAIIYYTGQDKYTTPQKFFNKFVDADLAKQLFNVPHKLVALNTFSNKTIITQHKLINLLEYVQKNIYIKDFFVNNKQLQILLENTSIAEYRQAVLKYLYVCANISDKQAFYKQLVIYAKTIGLTGEKFMGTLAEYWFEDGLRKGESKTIKAMAKKMLGAKIDFKIVAKLTGLKSAELKSYIT